MINGIQTYNKPIKHPNTAVLVVIKHRCIKFRENFTNNGNKEAKFLIRFNFSFKRKMI